MQWDGDAELTQLLKPIFKEKKLVIWHLDNHLSPAADIRTLIEPLGVELIEHTEFTSERCAPPRCFCSTQSKNLSPQTISTRVFSPTKDLIERVARDLLAADDIARSDAFLITLTTPLIELYMRYNRSIIIADAIRYDSLSYGDWNRYHEINKHIRNLYQHRRNIIGANSLYDVEYMYYYTGVRPDYITSFCAYTGVHYEPVRKSFLYAYRRVDPGFVRSGSWSDQFVREYKHIKATFIIQHTMDIYKLGYSHSDLAHHLAIVHLPYQVCYCL